MPSTNFIDGVTVLEADWHNDADALIYEGQFLPGVSVTVPVGLGVGGPPTANVGLLVQNNATFSGGTQAGVVANFTASQLGINSVYGFTTTLATLAAPFTCSEMIGYSMSDVTKGAGSVITTATGFNCENLTAGPAFNYAFRGKMAVGASGRFNCYMDGTADNYFAGPVLAGANTQPGPVYASIYGYKNIGNQTPGLFHHGAPDGTCLLCYHSSNTGTNAFAAFYTDTPLTIRGMIDYDRGANTTRYLTLSDARLKTKNGPAQYDPAWISGVAAAIFDVTWNETGYRVNTFVAQDLYPVEPDAVKQGDDGPIEHEEAEVWSVDPSKLIAKLILEVANLRSEFTAYKVAHP